VNLGPNLVDVSEGIDLFSIADFLFFFLLRPRLAGALPLCLALYSCKKSDSQLTSGKPNIKLKDVICFLLGIQYPLNHLNTKLG
jgi:hypothetical protein